VTLAQKAFASALVALVVLALLAASAVGSIPVNLLVMQGGG